MLERTRKISQQLAALFMFCVEGLLILCSVQHQRWRKWQGVQIKGKINKKTNVFIYKIDSPPLLLHGKSCSHA